MLFESVNICVFILFRIYYKFVLVNIAIFPLLCPYIDTNINSICVSIY